jgi:hypothetical protein
MKYVFYKFSCDSWRVSKKFIVSSFSKCPPLACTWHITLCMCMSKYTRKKLEGFLHIKKQTPILKCNGCKCLHFVAKIWGQLVAKYYVDESNLPIFGLLNNRLCKSPNWFTLIDLYMQRIYLVYQFHPMWLYSRNVSIIIKKESTIDNFKHFNAFFFFVMHFTYN